MPQADSLDCAALILQAVNKLKDSDGPDFRGCSFYNGLVGQPIHVNPTTIRAVDCNSTDCKLLFSSFVQSTANCSIQNDDTQSQVQISTLAGICLPTTQPPPSTSIAPTTPVPTNSSTISSPSTTAMTVAPVNMSSSSTTTIVSVVCAAVVVIAALAVFVWIKRRRSRRNDVQVVSPTKDADTFAYSASPALSDGNSWLALDDSIQKSAIHKHLDDLDMYRLPMTEVKLTRPLAEGAYGQVWLGEYNQQVVAIKRLLPSKCNAEELGKFMAEIVLLSRYKCDRRGVVSPVSLELTFYGAAWTRPTDIMMVSEYMEHGDLRQVLEKKQLSWHLKLQCAHHIAEALSYLHVLQPKVIHRDLKSRNVLLDGEFRAKLTDFGIAREMNDATMTAGIGTYRWMAPEVLQDGHYTEAADIFSFGVILAELETERLPYADLRNDKGNPLTDTAIMAKVMAGELTPSFSPTCPEWYSAIGKECLALDPRKRPTAMMLAFRFKRRLADEK
ncbi:unnamed protein product [Aphanomyces euteiches]